MPTLCPTCRASFPDDDVNVAKDVAYCKTCDKAYALSELAERVESPPDSDVDLGSPPKGAWYRDDGLEVSLGCSWRSISAGIFFLIFSTFWNAITWSILIAMIMGAANVSGPGITKANGGTVASIGAYFFLTPFVLVGLGTALATFMIFFGKVELRIRGKDAELRRGAGPLTFKSRFDLTTVTGVAIGKANYTRNRRAVYQIEVQGPGVTFGSGLNKDQQRFLAAAIRKVAGV